jgi:class 3 adenylate cyclase/DNA-binding response OmpR family regulator/predicted ATPase
MQRPCSRRRILIAAQQIDLRAKLARLLQTAGCSVELAESQKRALELAAGGGIEAAIVVHSAALCGLERELRDIVPRAIALGHPTDEIFRPDPSSRGIDPFSVETLDEQKLLDWLGRPSAESAEDATTPSPVILRIEDCELDLGDQTFVDGNGRKVRLTRAEAALLGTFVASPCQTLSRDQLRRSVVGQGMEPYDRSVDMLVARLRRKIEPCSTAPRFILTVPGVGYKFAARPQKAVDDKPPSALDPKQLVEAQATGLNQPNFGESVSASTPIRVIGSAHCEPQRRQVTVLSCGLVGSALAVDPEDLGSTVRRFQDACSPVITNWGGAVINSVGDEILALFGYPNGTEDDAERAVYASLDLVGNVGGQLSPSGEPLQLRLGVATGVVLIGENQAVIGEAIIMASRLRSISPPNAVIVTASTHKLLGSTFVCDHFELREFEGFSEPVTTYRVTGKRAIESRFVARTTGKLTQFAGRQAELQQMSTLWQQAKNGKGQVALLCGEAGIGKSRVCEEWLDCITNEAHILIRYQCSPHHTSSPFYPVIKQLENAARFEREDTPDVKLKKLEAMLSRAGSATRADIPLYASLLSIPTDGFYSSPDLRPQRQRDLTIAALLRQGLGFALAHPAVFVLEDAHWIDSSTLELFSRFIASIKAARVFVLVTFRPEFFPPWLDESHVTMLRLNRLPREQSEAIICDVAGHKELPHKLHEQIIRKADGIPLFAEELTKTVLESGLLQDMGERYVAVGAVSLAIPTTLLGSLTARLDRLGPVREIAQIGAAIGREFSYRLLAAVAPVSSPSLQTALAQLTACELIFARGEPPDSTYIFKHALVQDAAYTTMVRSKRQQLHSRIADALVEGFPETVETQPELMAHHFGQAGLTERAVECWRKAGRRAIERSANAEAIRLLTSALETLQFLPENSERKRAALELEVMLGQAMIADRGYSSPEARETLLRAKALIDDLTDPSQKFAILYGIWASHYVGGKVAKQRDAAAEFLAEAKRHKDAAALCIAHRVLGTTYVTTGEFAFGLRHLERARALYDSQHHACYRYQYGQDIGAAALCYLSWALWHLGYVDQASTVAAEAMKSAEALSHPHTLVYTICHARAFMDLFNRRYEDTQSYADRMISICTENGFSHWINCGRIFEGLGKISRGEVDQGSELLRAGMAGWQERGARLWLPIFLTLEAEAYAEAGRGDAGLQAIEKALSISKDTGERWAMAEMLRVKAHLLLATGRAEADEIETILVDSLEIARRQEARCWELRVAFDLACLWQDQGQGRKALKLLQSVYDQFTEGFDTADLRHAKALIRSLRQNIGRRQSKCTGNLGSYAGEPTTA